MVRFDRENLAKNLPDNFRQDRDSNNYKLLRLAAGEAERDRVDTADMEAAHDVNRAGGASLDQIGATFDIPRMGRDDNAYRMLVKAAIAKSLCTGEYDDIRRCLSALLGCGEDEIVIHDRKDRVGVFEMRVPLAGFLGTGLSNDEILTLLDELLPGGVGVRDVVLNGGFTYTAKGYGNDERKGYNIGAYSGYIKYGGQ